MILNSSRNYSTMTDRSQFILPNNQPVVELECASAFNALTPTEKLYAHHISRASWNGGLIVLVQTSPESPLIFVLLHKIFAGESIQDLKTAAVSEGISEDDFTVIIIPSPGLRLWKLSDLHYLI